MRRDFASDAYSWPDGVTAVKRPNDFCAWRGPSMLIVGTDGWAGTDGLSGFYFRETRYLSVLRLKIQDDDPLLCSLAEVRAHRIESTYNYPTVPIGGGGGSGSGREHTTKGILERGLDIRAVHEVHASSLEVRLTVTNRWNDVANFELAWLLDADFAAVLEAQNGIRQQNAIVERDSSPQGVNFRYRHSQLPLETRVTVAGGDWSFSDGRLHMQLQLSRQEVFECTLKIHAVDNIDPYDDVTALQRERELDRWYSSVAQLHAPGETQFAAIATRAIADVGSFALLEGPADEWLTPAAGVPLYLGLWGRDALTTVWQSALFDCGEMAISALNTMARLQGKKVDPGHDEEPGRIIQAARHGPLDRLGETPFTRYFGDYASPFDFIFALAHAYACRGDRDLLRHHWKTANNILEWATDCADLDHDGYLEYETHAEKGPRHQAWKDSNNAVVYEDGRPVDPPLASCEIQGYYFAALQAVSVMAAILGEPRAAIRFYKDAADLKARFNRDFWMDDKSFVAFGLDSEKRQIRALASNAGQCLATGIIDDKYIPRLVRRLFEPDLFSGWGIRTLSTTNPAYNPLDYHLGSIWLVENATIVFGLRRFGFADRALELTRALYDLALMWPGYRVPECVGGYAREELSHPGAYPRANAPQLWNQSAWPLMVQCLLGLQPFAPLELLAVDPRLPTWLPEITVSNLRIGNATLQIRFYRKGKKSHFQILDVEGDLKVIYQQPIGSLDVGVWDRLSALIAGMVAA